MSGLGFPKILDCMKLEQLIHAGVLCADLVTADEHFVVAGVADKNGIAYLKLALVALVNVADFENVVRYTYQIRPEPYEIIKPLRKNLDFAKYMRNQYVAHIHPALIAKAIEWQPSLRILTGDLKNSKAMLMVNLWLLETTINTYVDDKGANKIFETETDVMFPPDWQRFLRFVEVTIRGALAYLRLLIDLWSPLYKLPEGNSLDREIFEKAGQTEFKRLTK